MKQPGDSIWACCWGQEFPEHLVLVVWDLEAHGFDPAGECVRRWERRLKLWSIEKEEKERETRFDFILI